MFLAVMGTAGTIVVAMTLASTWRLERGFSRYVAQLELERVRGVVEVLQTEWATQGHWGGIPNEPEAFRRWVNPLLGGRGTAIGEGTERRPPRGERPPRREAWLGGGRPPPPWEDAGPGADPTPHDLRDAEPQPDRRRGPDRLALVRRLAVFDAQGQRVFGARFDLKRTVGLPVQVGAQTVGYVALEPLSRPLEASEAAFLSDQWRDALWLGLLALVLSTAVSLMFAWHLRRPVRQLVAATEALTQGQFSLRLPLERRDEFGLIVERFNQMAEQLGRQEQIRREWLANTSHELRTPLTVLRALIEALQEGVRQGDPATLKRLHEQVLLMSQLVNDLHQLAQHDAGHLQLDARKMDVRSLLEDVVDAQRPGLNQAGIEVTVLDQAGPATVMADAQRMAQLFNNLMENTRRYTDAPGQLRITLRVLAAAGGGHQWQAEFDDSAPGVSAHALPKLFDRFYRGEASRSRATGGSGLGLSICREIVQAHGGQMDAQPSPLGGLRINVNLPCEAPHD